MSLRKYRVIDVALFCGIALVLEIVNGIAFGTIGELFALSITVVLSAIVMMRWGWYAVFVAFFGALGYCIGNAATGVQYAVYLVGSVFVLCNLLWFLLKKDDIRRTAYLYVPFLLTMFLVVNLGRMTVGAIATGYFDIVDLLVADGLNFAIGVVIVVIAVRQKGLFEDQITYLRQLHGQHKNQDEYKYYETEELLVDTDTLHLQAVDGAIQDTEQLDD